MGSLIPFMDAGRIMGVTLDLMREAGRMAASGLKRKLGGIHPYPGDAKAICRSIVERCFRPDKGYFQTSLTTYTGFWARDFGRCVPSLIALGYREEVLSTYCYALSIYERANRFALAITPRGNLFDFPYYAPDGFAFFLKGLAHLDAPALLTRYRSLLERELARFADLVIDPKNGRVRADRHFSEAQDYAGG